MKTIFSVIFGKEIRQNPVTKSGLILKGVSLLSFFLSSCGSSQAPPTGTSLDTLQVKQSPPPMIDKKYLLGQFDPAKDSNFVKCVAPYAGGSALNQYLRREAWAAFLDMREAALAEGIELVILSATRPFSYQKTIWNAKWMGARLVEGKNLAKTISDPSSRAKEILKYSSMPGTSRHHWGTDIDLNAFNNGYFNQGKGQLEYAWLQNNASRFGFCQPYTQKNRGGRTGYEEEKWHWSYTPLSKEFLRAYNAQVTVEDIQGFQGDDASLKVGVIQAYVNGIGGDCK